MNKTSDVHGILLLDKPLGLTSNVAIQRAKYLFKTKKVGHTGSLDPLATGMLPICFGEATKFSRFLLESDKSYRVTAQLGIKTTTGDAEGEVVANNPVPSLTREQLLKMCQQFTGDLQQVPPMYSALKHNGQPLYKLARKGVEIERTPRQITIHQLRLIDYQQEQLTIEVHCSKGTYIRTLIEDIGEHLGCGAYVTHLHRLSVAPYAKQPMYSLEYLTEVLEREDRTGLMRLLLPIETALEKLPTVNLSLTSAFYFRQGQPVMVPKLPNEQGFICVFAEDKQFIGIGEVIEGTHLAPKRLIAA